MKLGPEKVDEDSERPAGKTGECFYCNQKRGEAHQPDCVIPTKTVVIVLGIQMVLDVPEFWKQGDIEFWMNDGSSCAQNLLDKIPDIEDPDGCPCNQVEGRYLREATELDHEALHWQPAEET